LSLSAAIQKRKAGGPLGASTGADLPLERGVNSVAASTGEAAERVARRCAAAAGIGRSYGLLARIRCAGRGPDAVGTNQTDRANR
jgi:hypothetical protein